MPAYLIVTREGAMENPSAMETYTRMLRESRPNVEAQPTPVVIHGNTLSLEGSAPQSVIVLQFPSLEAAKAWYESPEYQAALVHRKSAASFRAFIVEGI